MLFTFHNSARYFLNVRYFHNLRSSFSFEQDFHLALNLV